MVTYRELLKSQTAGLAQAGNDNASFECSELLGKALCIDCRSTEFEAALDKQAEAAPKAAFEELCKRRSNGEPLQYLLGEWEFYGMTLKVGRGVLIPRQDTETLVDLAINKYKNTDNINALDLCSGSGCIALALERHLKCASVWAVEKSDVAAGYLRENMDMHSSALKLVMGDVLDMETSKGMPQFDLIVCNPPYLTADDMAVLQTEVRHEPEEALYGGEDGLDFYRGVTRLWKHKLREGGMLIYEIGAGQEDDVMEILIQHGFENVRCKPDACGIIRCVMGVKR